MQETPATWKAYSERKFAIECKFGNRAERDELESQNEKPKKAIADEQPKAAVEERLEYS